MVGERAFFGKFISAMSYIPRSRELILGFSDGGLIGLESCFFGHLDLAPTLLDSTPTLLDGFRKESDGVPVIALHPSPNGLTLLYRTLNGQISSVSTADAPASGYEPDLDSFVQYAVVAILNEWDYSDIISTVIAASKTSSDPKFVDRFMESIFKSYDLIKGAEDTAQVEPFLPKASVLRRMLAFQLVLFQAFPEKSVQFKVTSALLHLQSIGEALSGCCTSEPSVLASHLELTPGVTPGQQPPQQLTFDTDALWSIYPLCGWTLDFCTILFRELAIFLNMKTATSSSSNLGSGGQSPQLHHSPTQSSSSSGGVAPSLLCFLYHSRARKTLRSVLILLEQYQLFVRNRELLYMRVIQTGGPIEAPPSAQNAKGGSNNSSGAPNSRINSMSISEAVALKDIHSANLFQHVEATFTKCPLKVGVLKSMLRDLNGIGTQVDFGRVNGNGSSGGNNPSSEVLDKVPSDHAIFINGTIPSTNSNAVAQAKTELRMITRRYPNPWDMNKLIFSTIHWFDLEPANMTPSLQAEPRQKVLAMHPSRCRIDPATALKARPSSMISANIGKQSFTLLQHQLPNMSNQGAPAGPRPQLTTAQARRQSHGFPEASSAVANGSTAGASGTSHIDTTALHSGSEIYDLPSIWGRVDNDGSDDGSMARNEGTDEAEASQLKSICFQWNSMLSDQEANQRLDGHDTIPEDEADMVPDDDVAMDNDFENEDDVESDEDLREKTRRDSRRMSMMATLKPSSQWLLHEFQTVSKRTRSDWTVFPVLGYDRPFAGFDSTTVESGQLTLLGLQGHAVPLDLRSSEDLLSSQSTIEAQVRKRRFGVDPIRKTKKYKTTGHGRQCIRCLQISTSNSANVKATLANSGFRRPIPHQIGLGPTAVNDIASTTLWYHNYDRSCICGGMWLEL
ncbi:hypothetical protein BGW38_000893 [Lunasporangiospora selenospora]|uniref:Mediator complex subunit 16 C-terminal domain-containing protein n=1 Tax=Lunasporangiospora selenospora TaxID=979761 RepID=A0A9P6KEM9_9FUNG|nr:hypothetical protein BGW38_000893 [Lunasporangiospora selenospora]